MQLKLLDCQFTYKLITNSFRHLKLDARVFVVVPRIIELIVLIFNSLQASTRRSIESIYILDQINLTMQTEMLKRY